MPYKRARRRKMQWTRKGKPVRSRVAKGEQLQQIRYRAPKKFDGEPRCEIRGCHRKAEAYQKGKLLCFKHAKEWDKEQDGNQTKWYNPKTYSMIRFVKGVDGYFMDANKLLHGVNITGTVKTEKEAMSKVKSFFKEHSSAAYKRQEKATAAAKVAAAKRR